MFRSRFSFLLSLAAIAVASAMSTATHRLVDAYDYVVLGVVRTANFVFDLFLGVAAPVRGARLDLKAQKQLNSSEQSMLRQAKRERPQVESLYRMCPST